MAVAKSLYLPYTGLVGEDVYLGGDTPSFDWSDVTDPRRVSYQIQVDNNPDFTSPEIEASNLPTSEHTPTAPLANGLYSWRVRAVDGAGNIGAYSAAYSPYHRDHAHADHSTDHILSSTYSNTTSNVPKTKTKIARRLAGFPMREVSFSKFATVTALIFLLYSIAVPTYASRSTSAFAQKFGNATSTNPPVEVTSQYWGTVYYPWYGGGSEGWEHWEDGVHIPPDTWSSMFLPDLGLYSSRDAATIDTHLSLLERARLDFALVSWWGRNSYEDRAFSMMLTRAALNASLHVKLAVYYELAGYDVLSVADIMADLQYIYVKANSPAYFRLADENGSYPVVFVYGIAGDPLEYTDRWSQARDQMYALGKPMFIVLKVWDGYRSYADKVDGWHQYAPATRYELQDGYSAFVSPGFWAIPELGGPFLSRSIEEFRIAVRQMAMLTLS